MMQGHAEQFDKCQGVRSRLPRTCGSVHSPQRCEKLWRRAASARWHGPATSTVCTRNVETGGEMQMAYCGQLYSIANCHTSYKRKACTPYWNAR